MQDQAFRMLEFEWPASPKVDMSERIPGIINTAGRFYLAKIKSRPPSQASEVWDAETTSQTLKLAQQITQVELMLDPANKAHVNLRQAMIDVRRCAFSSGTQLNQFEEAVNTLTNRCLVVIRKKSSAPPFLGEASASP
jgi:hypothetical protein